VLAVVLVLGLAAAFLVYDTVGAARGGRFPASVFSAYAAGVGVLLAQAVMVRRLESDPALRPAIEGGVGRA